MQEPGIVIVPLVLVLKEGEAGELQFKATLDHHADFPKGARVILRRKDGRQSHKNNLT